VPRAGSWAANSSATIHPRWCGSGDRPSARLDPDPGAGWPLPSSRASRCRWEPGGTTSTRWPAPVPRR
jgi:hypothetical protein